MKSLKNNDVYHPALTFVLALIITWFRAPARITDGFLWAEDGPVFMLEARLHGAASIFAPHAGYLHLVPRILAWVQDSQPISHAPYFFAWSALFLTTAASAYIAYAVRELPPLIATGLAIAPVLSPQNGEVLLNITNLQWMLFPCLLILLWECIYREPTKGITPRALCCVALTLTGPFGVFVSPFVLIAAMYVRRKGDISLHKFKILVPYFLACAVQGYVMVKYPAGHHDVGHLAWISRGIKELFSDLLPEKSLFAGALLACGLISTIWTSKLRSAGFLLLVLAIEIWAFSAARTNYDVASLEWYGAGSRYLYLPLLLCLWAGILAIASTTYKWTSYLGCTVVLIYLLATAVHFPALTWPHYTITYTPDGYAIGLPPDWHTFIPVKR